MAPTYAKRVRYSGGASSSLRRPRVAEALAEAQAMQRQDGRQAQVFYDLR